MSAVIVIPARWHSVRLPGKPLLRINGVPLLDRVIYLARQAAVDVASIVVATDDRRIADHCSEQGVDCIVSDRPVTSGSERVLAAVQTLAIRPSYIINLQGDAPFLPPAALIGVLGALEKGHPVATPVVQLDWPALDQLRNHKRLAPFSGTTCVRTNTGCARWFSKNIIPAIRDEDDRRRQHVLSPVFRHLGLYGYSLDALQRFEAAVPSDYEQIEQLEQLRFFDLGIPIQTVLVDAPRISMGGIDTLADIDLAEQLIDRYGDPIDR